MILNTTAHPINILDDTGAVIVTIPASHYRARVAIASETNDPLDFNGIKIPVRSLTIEPESDLPTTKEGIFYIVSRFIRLSSDRKDLLCTGTPVYEGGRIVGYKDLTR